MPTYCMEADKLLRVIKREIHKALNENLKKLVVHCLRPVTRCAVCLIAMGVD